MSDHRWTFHPERLHPLEHDSSSANHLTELQSLTPQQLIPPYRFSSECLPLHLDPPLTPLSVSPQVSSSKETVVKKRISAFYKCLFSEQKHWTQSKGNKSGKSWEHTTQPSHSLQYFWKNLVNKQTFRRFLYKNKKNGDLSLTIA